MKKNHAVLATTTLAALALVSACAPAAAPTAQIIRETVEVPVEVTAPPIVITAPPEQVAAEPGRLVVYSGRSESLVGPIIAQFAEATGVQVDVKYGSTAEIAATLLEEGANSPADVFFAQDPGGLGAVANAGLFAPLPEETLSLVPTGYRSPAGLWVGVSGRARVVVYNTEALAPADLPADVWDFTDPMWAGRIGWAPTNGSFQAMVTAMRVAWGEEKTREWLTAMQANAPKVFEGNTNIVEAVGAGEVEIGFVNHYYLYRFLKEQGEGFAARNYFLPGGGPGSLVMAAGAGQLETSANPDNAQRFIAFLLSTVAQQYFASQTYEYPLVEGVAVERGLPALAELNRLDVDMAALDDLAGTTRLLQETGVLP